MIKKAYSIQMSYNVTDEEKHQAELAILYFNHASKSLDKASDYLNIIKTPFKDNPDISTEEIVKERASIRKFRDKSVDKFNDFKLKSFRCIKVIQNFSSDTQTVKLIKSFITSIDDLQIKVNNYVDLFSNLQDKDFVKNIVEHIDLIQEQCENIDSIIEERIKSHIQTNILASNWINDVSDELQVEVTKKVPIILELSNQRQEQLNDILKERGNNVQG